MIKKLITALTTILGVSIISYMYFNSNMLTTLNAQSAPTFQLPKGAKVVLGKYNNKEIVWDIGNNNNNGSYVLMSSKPIVDSIGTYDASLPYVNNSLPSPENRESYCVRHAAGGSNPSSLYCPITPIKNEINKIVLNNSENTIIIKSPFLPSMNDVKNNGTLGLMLNERAYKKDIKYWLDGYIVSYTYNNGFYKNYYHHPLQYPLIGQSFDNNVTYDFADFDTGEFLSRNERIYWSKSRLSTGVVYKYAIRAFTTLDKTKVMFGANTSYTDGNWHDYQIDTSNLNENNESNPNKLRIESSLTVSLQDIKNVSNTKSVSKIIKNSSVNLYVNANTGNNAQISVLLYNEAGTDIQYYKMLEATRNGTNDYSLDLTGVTVGKYNLAVINEEYDASSNLPVESSAISDLMPLEIVEPHKLTYTKTPQSGASAGKEYEFSKNVNAGQAVGKVTVNPTGVTPLTYTLETNGDNSYLNFEIDGLDSNNASSSTPLNVKIKSGAPDLVNGGLKAGTYKFCITAVDANGDPVDTNGDPTEKVCTSFTVEKTKPDIEFDDLNQTKKSVADAATNWNETATATPNTGTKITYSVSGGDAYLIEIDEDSGEITYKGNGGFGKVKIKATVDDDSSTGDDNYESAFTEKEIVIYREVDGSVTPDANSSDTTTPTFTASDSNIRTGGIIGTIHGTLGTPDTIGGTTITYKYGLKTGGDASLFSVDANTGIIKATANLGVKSYHITVTVSDKWSTKEIPVTINVGVAAAEDLKFYETTAAINAITTKSVKVTDTGVIVFATVKYSLQGTTRRPRNGLLTTNGAMLPARGIAPVCCGGIQRGQRPIWHTTLRSKV